MMHTARVRLDCTFRAPLACLYVVGIGVACLVHSASHCAAQPINQPSADIKPFAPGIKIDWQRRLLYVDAVVVLREGPLELIACSPKTREHESLFVVSARPSSIFQAMGLIGLTHGSPVRYDKESERLLPPTGQRVRIRIRLGTNQSDRVVSVEQLMGLTGRRKTPESTAWVFSGSRLYHDGSFGADLDGTVICVVDFDTALISVGALHSADNELLWLEANTSMMPSLGTKCTILVDAAVAMIEVRLAADGSFWQGRHARSPGDVALMVRRERDDGRAARVMIRRSPDVSNSTVTAATQSLVRKGIDPEIIEVRPPHIETGLMPRPTSPVRTLPSETDGDGGG